MGGEPRLGSVGFRDLRDDPGPAARRGGEGRQAEVLGEAGYSAAEIAEMRSAKVV